MHFMLRSTKDNDTYPRAASAREPARTHARERLNAHRVPRVARLDARETPHRSNGLTVQDALAYPEETHTRGFR